MNDGPDRHSGSRWGPTSEASASPPTNPEGSGDRDRSTGPSDDGTDGGPAT